MFHDPAGTEPQMKIGRNRTSSVKRNVVLAYLQIARPDHWVKNVFVLPGVVLAMSVDHSVVDRSLAWRLIIGLMSTCLIASSNYVINEILDAPSDRHHPLKRMRPIPSGQLRVEWAYVLWLVLMAGGMSLASLLSRGFVTSMLALWVMGLVYNVKPLRTKEIPYLDVLSEAINNPIRMLAGWYLAGTTQIPPATVLLSYWMVGCYFMAIKRFAELRDFDNARHASDYRRSFAYYNDIRLLVSIMFYGSTAMLFFGAFLIRYRIELVLSFPVVAWVMAAYLRIGFEKNSAAQAPEKLYRCKALLIPVVACAVVLTFLTSIDLPLFGWLFSPTIPVAR